MTTGIEPQTLTDAQWEEYQSEGYLRLGKLIDDEELRGLRDRIDAIMQGEADVPYHRMLMQRGSPDGSPKGNGPQSTGFKGATLNYRKIEGLELDPLFHSYMSRPLYRQVTALIYGADTDIGIFRAMFLNKPAGSGTPLPWHQDRWIDLDRDPRLTIYLTLDDATLENGCVTIIPQSHHLGVINPTSGAGFLTGEQADDVTARREALPLEMAAGEVVLLDNWTLHSSAANTSGRPRRAFSLCLMEADTRRRESGEVFYPYVLFSGSTEPEEASP